MSQRRLPTPGGGSERRYLGLGGKASLARANTSAISSMTKTVSRSSDFHYYRGGGGPGPSSSTYNTPWDVYSQQPISTVDSTIDASVSNYPSNFQGINWRSSGLPVSQYSLAGGVSEYVRARDNYSGARPGTVPPDLRFMLGEALPAPTRQWEHTGLGSVLRNKKNETSVVGNGVRFTLMSYNVLAPSLLEGHPELYGACDPACLDWEKRLSALLTEIDTYDPDILCLQEVEDAQYMLNFEPKLQDRGYRGVFKKKTRDKQDGCAIFYKTVKFLLMDRLDIEFLQPHIPLLNRDNIGILVKLETRNVVKRQKLIVGTTHLLFNPKRLDVRLAQTQVLLAELDRFAFCGFDRNGDSQYHPILMTGDFNCKPINSVIKLLTERQLTYTDENGELIRLLKRTGFNSLLPSQCGITDQCQHYKLALERYKRWKTSRNYQFELDLKVQHSLVNLFPYMGSRETPFIESEACLLSPQHEEIASLLSPVTEGVEPIPSVVDTSDPKLLEKAAKKIAMQIMRPVTPIRASNLSYTEVGDGEFHQHMPEDVDMKVVAEMKRCGMTCEFGSGQLSHNILFRDIHAPKLDRTVDGGPVSTRQHGWICVDYIFQSMVYNSQLNKVIEGKLKLIRRLGLLSRGQCKEVGEIPNSDHPSDHFPLIAEFLLR